MKVGFAIKSLNVVGGGAERVLVDVGNELVRRGHDVFVVTFDGPGASFYELDARLRRFDLDVGPPGQPTPRGALLRSLPRMRRIVRDERPDVMVGFMHSIYLPLAVALAGTGTRLVASEHIGEHHYRARPLQRWLVGALDRLFVGKTVPSEEIRKGFAGRARTPVTVLPNPLDVAVFAEAGRRPPVQPPVLLSIGRFMAQKNQHELIAAFATVAAEFPEWTLRLVGEGDLRPQLEAQVARLGLGGRIVLPGVVKDIQHEYARASVVVVPSLYESFGLVTAEAHAAARPVIGLATCPGTNELIDDGGNGLLVPGDGDRVRALAEGMRRLMADAALRAVLGAAGPASSARFSLRPVVDVWEAFLARCAADRPR